MRIAIVLALTVVTGAAPAAQKPSFDCAKAATQVEKLVCSDDGLATLDRQLADVFGKLLAAHKDQATDIRDTER